MADIAGIVKSSFPHADTHILDYVEGVLNGGSEDFESSDDVYDAVGDMLLEVSSSSPSSAEDDVRSLCSKLFRLLRPSPVGGADDDDDAAAVGSASAVVVNGASAAAASAKKLAAPVRLAAAAAANAQADADDADEMSSIWLTKRDDNTKVDQTKLAKAEAKIRQKQDKISSGPPGGGGGGGGGGEPMTNSVAAAAASTAAASASQVLSKKDVRMEARGALNSKDIRIENFDLAYGDKTLISGATLSLAYGRRYGFVGRNGLGKTTLLRMLSSRQLMIPSHISVLHVEQEVAGDDTPALESVLQCDERRNALLAEEKAINAEIAASGSTDPRLSARLTQVYAELEDAEADKAPARAGCILAGLGFSAEAQTRATKEFSGGWRMRLALARALFSRPDLLLLDEPTNMLDMKAIIWLENYLATWPSTILVVSHDRHFLDVVPTDILHLHSRRMDTYKGDYSTFVKTRADRLRNQQKEYEAQMAARAHAQEFIDKFRYNAKRASLVQSKIKALERMPVLVAVEKEVDVTLKFPDDSARGLSPPILQMDEVGFRYSPTSRIIFSGVNLNATMESRVCIVGENGAGKTTLLKVVLGELSPSSGTITVHRNLKFGYFAQHHVDQLDLTVSCIRVMESKFPGKPTEEYRRQLGAFGLTGDLALQRVANLSGGQKSRLAFAVLAAAAPNFLVLDEPTNHLDIETIEALGRALNEFAGGVILVSHDERLIRMICKELWVCGDGTVRSLEGGFDEYRRIVERELAAQQAVK